MELFLIGIGTGNPDHVTAQAAQAIAGADLVLVPQKGPAKGDLAAVRHLILDRHLPKSARIAPFDMPERDASGGYAPGVSDWHDAIAAAWANAIANAIADAIAAAPPAPAPARVALLVWGDPMLYDSTLRIAARLPGLNLPKPTLRVIPGITAIQALCAAHAIPLNEVAEPVLITTGRQLRDKGWPSGAPDTMVVLLDGECSFQTLPPEGIHIWWGAFLGMAEEVLDHGPLAEAAPRILATRRAARAAHGWIMDVYLMRRSAG